MKDNTSDYPRNGGGYGGDGQGASGLNAQQVTWNLYDQSTQSTYPDRTSGYWRNKPEAEISSIYSKFTQTFGDALGRVNAWASGEQMGGILVRGRTVWLLRVHNGGKDTRNRPQRWVIAACRSVIPEGYGIDIDGWLNGGQWPFSGVIAADVVIPPQAAYVVPLKKCGEDDWRNAPRELTSLKVTQAALNAWLGAPHRGANGSVFFSTAGGDFPVIGEGFPYGPEPKPKPKPVPPPAVQAGSQMDRRGHEALQAICNDLKDRLDARKSHLQHLYCFLVFSVLLNVWLGFLFAKPFVEGKAGGKTTPAAQRKPAADTDAGAAKTQDTTPQQKKELPPAPPPAPADKAGTPANKTQTVASPGKHEAGDTETVDLGNGVTLEMAWCPAGRFQMGSPEKEPGRNVDEILHPVTLTKGFWIGRTEVTEAQWDAVMGAPPNLSPESKAKPMAHVSWDDCREFVDKLNAKLADGRHFRLPTEAEWEYACRAGTHTAFNYKDRMGTVGKMASWMTGEQEKKLPPNAWGLHDMHGGVWEWCEDWYGTYPSGAVIDPVGVPSPGAKNDRVARGGLRTIINPGPSSSAYRHHEKSSHRGDNFGFRLARSEETTKN